VALIFGLPPFRFPNGKCISIVDFPATVVFHLIAFSVIYINIFAISNIIMLNPCRAVIATECYSGVALKIDESKHVVLKSLNNIEIWSIISVTIF